MEKVTVDDVRNEVNPLQVHEVRRPVSQVLGTEHFAMNYFELQPGDSFSGGLHAHHDQEEVFYIEDGQAVFEVGREREEVTVDSGEVIRFEPGEFQTGHAPEDREDPTVGWALGAPGARHDSDDLESMVPCRECGEEQPHATTLTDEGSFSFTCNECGTEFSL
jgi:mannose-6-phosphate isomerase-like protein (cupin superfamily)